MKINHITLLGASPSLEFSSLSLDLSQKKPLVILGANGTGKSLIVSAVKSVFENGQNNLRFSNNLYAAGLERIKLQVEDRENTFEAVFSFSDGKLTIHSEHADLLCQHFNINEELLKNLFFIRSGNLSVNFSNGLLEKLAEISKTPVERDLAGWNFKRTKLLGDTGQEGRLTIAKLEQVSLKQEIDGIEARWRTYEDCRRSESETKSQLTTAYEQRLVIESEQVELQKIIVLSQRAVRLQSWIEELTADRQQVVELRSNHLAYQERVEILEKKFRNAPENFDELLSQFQFLKQKDVQLQLKVSELNQKSEFISSEISAVKQSLEQIENNNQLTTPSISTELEHEISARESELLEHLRNRIGLLRQREGLQQEIYKHYGEYALLEPEELLQLSEYIGFIKDSAGDPIAHGESQVNHEGELEKTQRILKESFSGFENLPNDSSSLIQNLFEIRRNIQNLHLQLEARGKKNSQNEFGYKNKYMRWLYIGGLSGVAFASVTAVSTWDIGAFAGLAASGIALLTQKAVFSKSESQFEMNLVNYQAAEKQYRIAKEAEENLEAVLGPLSKYDSFEMAHSKYLEYKSLVDRETDLSIEAVVRQSQGQNFSRALESIRSKLPATLQEKATTTLCTEYDEFLSRRDKLDLLAIEWKNYDEGGRKAVLIALIESELVELKDRLNNTKKISDAARELNAIEVEKLKQQLDDLTAMDSNCRQEIDFFKSQLEANLNQLNTIEHNSGDILIEIDNSDLADEWKELKDLRLALRETRDKLSHHQSLDEINARQSLLTEEFDEVNEKLRELDLLYLLNGTVAHYAEKYENQMRGLRNSQLDNKERVQKLEADLKNNKSEVLLKLLNDEGDINDLKKKYDEIMEDVQSLQEELIRTEEFIQALQDELYHFDHIFRESIFLSISQRLRDVTEGSLTSIRIDENSDLIIENKLGQIKHIDGLSGGLQDLVWLTLRLFLIEQIKVADSTPIFWDEPFSRLDESYLKRVWKMIVDASSQRQFVILSKDYKQDYENYLIEIRQRYPYNLSTNH